MESFRSSKAQEIQAFGPNIEDALNSLNPTLLNKKNHYKLK